MSFKVPTMWSIFLIALYLPYLIAPPPDKKDATNLLLPTINVKEATECLRDFMKEKFISISFRGRLSYGEYLGELCNNDNALDIEERVQADTEHHGSEVKDCLEGESLHNVYEAYHEFGVKEVDKLKGVIQTPKQKTVYEDSSRAPLLSDYMDEDKSADDIASAEIIKKENKNETTPPASKSQTPQVVPPVAVVDVSSKDIGSKVTESQPSQLSASTDQQKSIQKNDTSVTDKSGKLPAQANATKKDVPNFSDLSKFVIGLCFMNKRVNFRKLQNKAEKTKTFDCLGDCTSRFIYRIKSILNEERERMIKFLNDKIELLNKLNEKNNDEPPSREITLTPDQYREQIEKYKKATKISEIGDTFEIEIRQVLEKDNIEKITDIGRKYLERYRLIYNVEDKYLSEQGAESDKNPDQDVAVVPKMEQKQDVESGKNSDLDGAVVPQMVEKPNKNTKNDGDEDQVDASDSTPQLPDDETEESFESKLSSSLEFYKSCAKMQCFMKHQSMPLLEFIRETAQKQENNTMLKDESQMLVAESDEIEEPKYGKIRNNGEPLYNAKISTSAKDEIVKREHDITSEVEKRKSESDITPEIKKQKLETDNSSQVEKLVASSLNTKDENTSLGKFYEVLTKYDDFRNDDEDDEDSSSSEEEPENANESVPITSAQLNDTGYL